MSLARLFSTELSMLLPQIHRVMYFICALREDRQKGKEALTLS